MEFERQPLTPFWTFMVRYGFVLVTMAFYVTAAMHFDYTPDDTYIYLQYAKNIANGDGFAFNAGEPSYGVTSPLWTLLIAAGAKIGLDPYIVAKIFDLVFASVAVSLVYLLAFLIVRDKRYAVIAATVFSFNAWFLRWAGTGMETSLAVVLVLLSFLYVYRNEYHLAAFASGVLTLVRPEGVLLFALIQVDNFLNTTEYKPALKSFLVSCGIYAVVIAPWVIFSWVYFGSPLPNTLGAKSSTHLWWEGVVTEATTIVQVLGSSSGMMVLALLLGMGLIWKYGKWERVRLDFFGLLWIVTLPVAYMAMNVQVVSRYLMIVSPLVVIYGMLSMKSLEEAYRLKERTVTIMLVALASVSLCANQYVYRSMLEPHMEQFTAGMNEALKPIAYWLSDETEKDAVVLVPDVGLIGYVSERKVFDTAGIVTPEVKKAFHGATYDEAMAGEMYRDAVEPDYLVDRSAEPERLASLRMLPVMTTMFPSMGARHPDAVYYTLYKVAKEE